MLKAKKFDIADSNIANLGSDLEKKCKLAAAQQENAWADAGKKVGLEVWRIEKFLVVRWPKEQYGKFYSGDSYIVLRTYKKDPNSSDKLAYDVFFWIGNNSTQDEYGTAAYKTVELDDVLGGDPVQHREIQDYESPSFLNLFDKFEALDGGIESGFNKVTPETYRPRLLHLKGKKKIIIREVPMTRESLNSGDVFIVDAGLHLYQFNGKKSGGIERATAAQVCRAIDDERKGLPEVHVFTEGDKDATAKTFWSFIQGGEGPIKTAEEGGSDDAAGKATKRLFRLSDATGDFKFTECPKVARSQLDSNDVFILDAGFEVFVWIGKGASKNERSQGLAFATDYLFKYDRPKQLPITRVMEGGENEVFNAALDSN